MKIYSLLFISFLFTISCTDEFLKFKPTSQEIQQNLVEIAKEPLSEAVFATMATQLSTEGGFERVVGLLEQLITDAKRQLHGIVRTWRGVNTRCEISKVMLQTRRDFFEAQLAVTRKIIANRKQDIEEQSELLTTYTTNAKVLQAFHKASVARHAYFIKRSASGRKAVQEGLAIAKAARKQISEWSPKNAALLQTNLSKIMKAYKAASTHDLTDPSEFIQRSTSHKVRARLLQWINILIGRLGMALDNYDLGKKEITQFNNMDKDVQSLVTSLNDDSVGIRKHIAASNSDLVTFGKSEVLYTKLVEQTVKLISANKQYCSVESSNFNRNRKRITSEITLFREVLRYFRNHYSRVHDFIRSKYNH